MTLLEPTGVPELSLKHPRPHFYCFLLRWALFWVALEPICIDLAFHFWWPITKRNAKNLPGTSAETCVVSCEFTVADPLRTISVYPYMSCWPMCSRVAPCGEYNRTLERSAREARARSSSIIIYNIGNYRKISGTIVKYREQSLMS